MTALDLLVAEADELLVIVGPTASGKTALAIELSDRLDGEVVGADSVQVYRHFDIGSGKPSPEERQRARHHLVDVVEPTDALDAARYAERADAAIAEIRSRGRRPIVCGGTFLWVKALVWGLAPSAPASTELRDRHTALIETEGRAALHARLARVDPDSAANLDKNDFVRVSRALEVYELTGKTQWAWHQEHGFRTPRHRARLIGPELDRPALDARIAARTHRWLNEGWIEEVKDLVERGFERTRAMGAVGYKQIRAHLRGELPRADLEQAIVRATRTYVRRQRTWLRDQPVEWVAPPVPVPVPEK